MKPYIVVMRWAWRTFKHIPEMQAHAGLARAPLFAPAVARFYRGMLVELPLQLWALPGTPAPRDIHAVLANAYAGRPLVEVASLEEAAANANLLDAELLAGSNRMKLFVFGNEAAGQVRLVAALDNLGKGAGGAAVQRSSWNIMLGLAGDDRSLGQHSWLRMLSIRMYWRAWRGSGLGVLVVVALGAFGVARMIARPPPPKGYSGLEFARR